jgi:pilus assembly protein CpaE
VARALFGDLEKRPGITVETRTSLGAAKATALERSATVILTCPSIAPDDAVALASELDAADVGTVIVVVAADVDTALLRSAMKASVRDVLAASDGPEAIIAAVLSADESVGRRRGTEVPAGERAAAGTALALGRVITVFSTKGGVGKSVMATNLGVALAKDLGKRTILVDLDLQFGDVSVMLQAPPERTIYDAVQVFDRLDAEMLRGFLVQHESGLQMLLAPVQPEEAEVVTTARITQILTMLRQLAEYVVVDTPAALSEVVLTALEQSDCILAVLTMDVPSVKNTKVSLQKLHQLGLDGELVRLVLNRADSKVWLELHEIEKAISDRIVARIPSDRLVPRSVNKGVPVVMDAPKSAVARSIVALAREVANEWGSRT